MSILNDRAVNRLFGAVLSAGDRLPPDLRAELDLWDSLAERQDAAAMPADLVAMAGNLADRIEAACPLQHGRIVRSSSVPPPV